MTSVELLLCILLLTVSGYLSASEVALFSLSRFQLKYLKENFRPTHRRIKRLLSDPGGLLITILVVNEIVNISFSVTIAEIVARSPSPLTHRFPEIPRWLSDTLIGMMITTPLLLLLGELTPKAISVKINQVVATMTAGPLSVIYTVLGPVRFLLKYIIRAVASRIIRRKAPHPDGQEAEGDEKILREADFLLMLEEGQKEGAIQESEIELIRNVFDLDNMTALDIATPLAQVLSLPVQATTKEALAAVRSQKFSRIPITGVNRKEVVGILYAKDLLRSKLVTGVSESTVAPLMRRPLFVSPKLKLNALFRKFKQQRTHMAIIKNPDGSVAGVVTMNDVLEALFEDFFPDEPDPIRTHRRELA